MRTLLVAPALHSAHGGIPRILRLYQRALTDVGDTVDVLVLNDEPQHLAHPRNAASSDKSPPAAYDPTRPRAIGCSRRKPAFVLHLLRLGWRADRIVCGHIHLLPALRPLQILRPRLAVFVVAHGIEAWRRLSRAELAALAAATGVLCVSDFTRRELLTHNPELPPDRTIVVPNSLEPDFTTGTPPAPAPTDPSHARSHSGSSDPAPSGRGPRLLTVARLSAVDRDKGVETAIAALPLVRRDFPDATLRIVGTGDDRARLEREVRGAANKEQGMERGAGPAVVFLGAVDDARLRAEYAACTVFVLPSRKEGFGLVYLEAMAFGKPCVAARAGGAPEVVTDAVGRLVPFGDPAAVAGAIVELLHRPPDPEIVRAHAATFRYEAFRGRLAEAIGAKVAGRGAAESGKGGRRRETGDRRPEPL